MDPVTGRYGWIRRPASERSSQTIRRFQVERRGLGGFRKWFPVYPLPIFYQNAKIHCGAPEGRTALSFETPIGVLEAYNLTKFQAPSTSGLAKNRGQSFSLFRPYLRCYENNFRFFSFFGVSGTGASIPPKLIVLNWPGMPERI